MNTGILGVCVGGVGGVYRQGSFIEYKVEINIVHQGLMLPLSKINDEPASPTKARWTNCS